MVTFTIGGKLYGDEVVKKLSYSLTRDTSASGEPIGRILGGKIEVHIEQAFHDTFLFEAMVEGEGTVPKDGKIEFFDSQKRLKKTLQFQTGYVISYNEYYDKRDLTTSKQGDSKPNNTSKNIPVTVAVVISSEKLVLGSGDHDNKWTLE